MQAYERLEKKLGEWCGRANTVVCSSGTTALQLALQSLEIPQGSEVLVPDFTMIACARAVTLAGLKPVFVDCNDSDLLMNIEDMKNKFTSTTKAIMPVHIYGRQCAMDDIHEFAQRTQRVFVIEDLAEAHGITPHPDTDAACWSFYKNKIIAGEEGGAVAFNGGYFSDAYYADRARSLRSLGFTPEHDFKHIPGGINARLSNANAKLILEDLSNCLVAALNRGVVEHYYDYELKINPDVQLMPPRKVAWVYDIRLKGGIDIGAVVHELNNGGRDIQARRAFVPMSMQAEYHCRQPTAYSAAYKASQEVMYLPIKEHGSLISEGRVSLICSLLKDAIQKCKINAAL